MMIKNTLRYLKTATLFSVLAVGLIGLQASSFNASGGTSENYLPALTYEDGQIFEMDRLLQASSPPQSSVYKGYTEVMSDPVTPAFSFSAVGFTWNEYVPEGTSAGIQVRFLQKGQWGEWNDLPRDIDHKEDDETELGPDGLQDSFLPIDPAEAYQHRVILTGDGKNTPIIKNIQVTTINAKDSPKVNGLIARSSISAQITQDMVSTGRPRVISRSEWGADEGLRVYHGDQAIPPVIKLDPEYQDKFTDELQIARKVTTNDKGELLSWPQEYPAKISKIIVHHTASTATLSDPKKALRDIYYWHTMGRGWGDIGYNYIIDPYGNIYEGRAGGEMVIGAHAGKANTGSIGISVMGNYETTDVVDQSLVALAKLISEKTKMYGIDPTGTSLFRGQITSNIIGHRDVMSTSCPGKNLYAKLPLIAQLAKSTMSTTVEDPSFKRQKDAGYNYEDKSGILFTNLNPEQPKIIPIVMQNTGTVTWGPQTSIVVNEIDTIKDFIQVQPPAGRIDFPMSSAYSVGPGGMATFNLVLAGGFRATTKTIKIAPLIDGKKKLGKYIEISVQTSPAQFTYDLVSTSPVPAVMKSGAPFTFTVELKNTGNVNWQNKGGKNVRLGTEQPRDRKTTFLATPDARAGFLLGQDVVRPGEIGRFTFNLIAPKVAGPYEEHFAPVVEGLSWMADKGIQFKTFVYSKDFEALPVSTGSITAIPKSTQISTVKLENMGGTTWTYLNAPQFKKTGASRLQVVGTTMMEAQVGPGEVGTFNVAITVPAAFRVGKVKIDAYMGGAKITTKTMTVQARRSDAPLQPSTTILSTPPVAAPPIALPGSVITPPSSSLGSSPKGNNVRVLLGYTGSSPVVSSSGSFSIKAGSYSAGFAANTQVTVNAQGSSYVVTANNFFQTVTGPLQFVPDSGAIMRIDNWERRPSWNTALNDNEFRGVLEIRTEGIINELPIEDYLRGLAETLNDDPVEKKKAIVVAARNYVLYYSTVGKGTKFPGKPYDVDDNPEHSQKYMGYGFEKRSPNSVASVEATSGIVIKYLGNIVRAPYFSSDDGRTRSAAEVWGWKDAGYLISVGDPYCAGGQMAGHGVGMSGCGALGMAKKGSNYQDILRYYYQNITIEKVY